MYEDEICFRSRGHMLFHYVVYTYDDMRSNSMAQRAGVIPPCLIPQSTHNNQTNTFTNNGEHFPLDNQKQSCAL